MPKSDLERFVLDALTEAGAIAEPRGYGLTEVMLPDALAARLSVSAWLLLAFESEAAREAPDALLVTYGHPLLDELIAYVLERRRGFRFYPSLESRDYDLSEQRVSALVEDGLEFRKTRRPVILSMMPVMCYDFLFGFRVTWQSSTRIEETMTTLVNGHGHSLAESEPQYQRCFWQERPEPEAIVLPTLPTLAFQTICQQAWVGIQDLARTRSKALMALDQGKYDIEYQRMQTYYAGTLEDLGTKIDKAPEERKAVIRERYQAAVADRDRRLADLQAAYHVEHQVALDHARLYAVPRMRVSLGLQHKSSQLPAVVLVNLLTRTLDPFDCQGCGRPAQSLSWDDGWFGGCCRS